MVFMRLRGIYVGTCQVLVCTMGMGRVYFTKKIEMKLKDLILSFIHRHKSHIISILNALQKSCFWSACLL